MRKEATRLLLDGVVNLRDVGGYETKNGRFVHPQTLLRADCLHRLPTASQQALVNYGLCSVVDLRRRVEIEHEPNVFAQSDHVTYHHLPLYNEWEELAAERPRDLAHMYTLMLDNCQPAFRDLFTLLAQPGAFPTLVHCKVGKDRTGVVIALLLDVAGVPAATITTDYALSRPYLDPLIPELREEARQLGYDMVYYESLLPSEPVTMRFMLDHLYQQYGGAAGYLAHIGLTADQIAFLQQTLSG